MKPLITTKIMMDSGDIHTLELFNCKGAYVLHKHVLTSNESKAELFQKMRKFWNKWYCKQEIVITKEEYRSIIEIFVTKQNIKYKQN